MENYRGWSVSWDYGYFTAFGPDYDASYEGPEDGWVSNGQYVQGRTLDDLRAEVDAWFEENDPASVDERPEGQDPKGLEAKPASAVGAAETPKTSTIESEIERLGGGA